VTEPAGGIPGATNGFVVRPDELEIVAVRRPDATPNPGVSVPTGAVFVAAGMPFEVDVRVLDAEGSLTPNFGRESAPEGLRLGLGLLLRGQHDQRDATRRLLRAKALHELEAVELRHDEVGEDHRRVLAGGELHGFERVVAVAEVDVLVRREHAPHRLADDRLVVH